MEQSRHPIDIVARETGFGDRDHMRRAFLRTLAGAEGRAALTKAGLEPLGAAR